MMQTSTSPKAVVSSGKSLCSFLHEEHFPKKICHHLRLYDDFANFAPQKKKTGNMPEEMFIYDTDCTDAPMFDRGFTGHEHLYAFGLINMNGRVYDPQMSSFLSPDNFIQCPDNPQNFNRYAYCLNNPLRFTDPSGESFIVAAVVIGAVIGTYSGGVIANGTYNPIDWDWSSDKTWCYMLCGSLAGAISGYVGAVVAGTGIPLCNTLSIVTASTLNSGLTYLYTDCKTDFVVSMGVASYNFSKGEFGYLGKEGNSLMDNIGYTLGAITNLCDLYRLVTWDLLTPEEKLAVIKKSIEDKNVKVTYDKNLHGEGQFNKETKEITIGWNGLNKGKGWAKSTLQHEYKHYLDISLGNGNAENSLLDFYAYCEELRNAKQNGLTFLQHKELIKRTLDCADALKISVGELPKYTFVEWLRSIIYF